MQPEHPRARRPLAALVAVAVALTLAIGAGWWAGEGPGAGPAAPAPDPAGRGAGFAAYGRTPADFGRLPEPDLRLPYAGADPRQFGDLYLPRPRDPALPVPVVVLIHGGGWTQGSTLRATAPMAADLVRAGVAVWNVEYRGTGRPAPEPADPAAPPPEPAGPGGWPRTHEDVAAAVDFLPRLAGRSPVALDLSRVVVAGVSAGGNLTAWLASRPVLPDGAPGAGPGFRPAAFVPMAGVFDLALAHGRDDRFVRGLLGGTPEQRPERYRLASPARNVDPGMRITVLHGRNDRVVDVAEAEVYADRIGAMGGRVDLRILDDADHASWGRLDGPQWAQAREAILGHARG